MHFSFLLRAFSCFASALKMGWSYGMLRRDTMLTTTCCAVGVDQNPLWPLNVTCKLSGERLFEKNLDLAPGPGSRSLRHQKSQCLSKERLLWIAFGGPCAWIRPYLRSMNGTASLKRCRKAVWRDGESCSRCTCSPSVITCSFCPENHRT